MDIKSFTFDESELKVPIRINDREYMADVSAAARIKYLTIFEGVPQMIAQILEPIQEGGEGEQDLFEKQAAVATKLSDALYEKDTQLLSVFFDEATIQEVNASTLPPEVYDDLTNYLVSKLLDNDSDGDEDEEGSGK